MAVEEQYANGPECMIVAGDDGQVDLHRLLVELAGRGVNEVLVEAGPRLAGLLPGKGWWTNSRFSSPASSSDLPRGPCWTGRWRR